MTQWMFTASATVPGRDFDWHLWEFIDEYARYAMRDRDYVSVLIKVRVTSGHNLEASSVEEARAAVEQRGESVDHLAYYLSVLDREEDSLPSFTVYAEVDWMNGRKPVGFDDFVTFSGVNEAEVKGLAKVMEEEWAREQHIDIPDEKPERAWAPAPAPSEKDPFHKRYLWPNHPIGAVLWGLVAFGISALLLWLF